jgi:hypothetical protein
MKKHIYTLATVIALASMPAFAGKDHDHGTAPGTESVAPAQGHGSPQDDHSKIVALDVSPEEAVSALEIGLTDLLAKVESSATQDVATGAFSLMSAVKTLKDASPHERQAAALKQLDQQLDGAKHAAEDGNLEKAKSYVVKAQSALKLYNAMQ